MLVIRLQRTGRSNLSTYRIVVAEKARAAQGKFQQILGHYLPSQNEAVFKADTEAIASWIQKGAVPSDTLARLLKRQGMSNMDKFIKRYTKKKPKKAPPEVAPPIVQASTMPVAEQTPSDATVVPEEQPTPPETTGDNA